MKQIVSFIVCVVLFCACSDNKQFDAMGVFESDEVLVSSEVSGMILEFSAKEGDILEAGTIVGHIDSTQLELNIKRLEAQIRSLESQKVNIATQTAPLNAQIATAKSEKGRSERLVASNAATQKSLDDINAELSVLNSELESTTSTYENTNDSLDAEIARTKIEIDILKDNLGKTRIIAPINGTVLEKYAFEGELSSPNKALFKIADVETLRLKAYIIDTDLTKIKLGDEVAVFSDFGDDYKEYKGKISWISSKAEFTPKTIMTKDERKNLVYAIKVDVPNTDGLLKIGSYGEVRFSFNKDK